jgi:hypothetical protein
MTLPLPMHFIKHIPPNFLMFIVLVSWNMDRNEFKLDNHKTVVNMITEWVLKNKGVIR